MKHQGIAIGGGFKINGDGKKVLARIKGFGLNKSAQIAQAKSKRVKPVKRAPA